MPTTLCPCAMEPRTIARIAALSPGQSPPPVRTPKTLIGRSPVYERGGVWGAGRFPTLSGRRGQTQLSQGSVAEKNGETWFPPRTRAGGERCSIEEHRLPEDVAHLRPVLVLVVE